MPGQEYIFRIAFKCRRCGQPSTKVFCDACKVHRARANALHNQQRAQTLKEKRRKEKNVFYTDKTKTKNKLKAESDKRRTQTACYGNLRKPFLEEHPICPVTGGSTTDIHHSAHKEGAWLNLRYYWIALSRKGHRILEDNPEWAFANHLRVKVNAIYDHHVSSLVNDGIDIDKPLFYQIWNGNLIPRP